MLQELKFGHALYGSRCTGFLGNLMHKFLRNGLVV